MDEHDAALDDRLESIGWGAVFLLVAAIALPHGTQQYALVGLVGALLLALNVYRMRAHVEVSWFGIVLGGSCAIACVAALAGLHPDLFVVFFVLAAIVTFGLALRPRRSRHQTADLQ